LLWGERLAWFGWLGFAFTRLWQTGMGNQAINIGAEIEQRAVEGVKRSLLLDKILQDLAHRHF